MHRPVTPAHAALSVDCARALADADALAIGAVRDGVIVHASAALARLLGLSPDDALRSFSDFVSETDRARVARALASPGEIAIGFRGVRADGSLFEAHVAGTPTELAGGAAMAIALQETGRDREARPLSYAELFDGATALPNRGLLFDRIEQALLDASRSGRRVAVLAIEVADAAAAPVDAVRHSPALLKDIGERLRASLRESDTLAFVEAGRFAALLPKIGARVLAATPAVRALAALAAPIGLPGGSQRVACRVGIATYPEDAGTPAALLERALGALRSGEAIAYARTRAEHAPPSPARVEWSKRFEVGLEVIDGQHRHLLELINRLGEELRCARDADALVDGLRELVRYTEHHFATEERLMEEIGAEAPRHRAEHRRLVDTLTRLTLRLDPEGVSEGSRFLQDWLFRHIDEVDRPFAALLRSHGVK